MFAVSEFTRILSAIDQGDPQAPAQLLPLVYEELRRLAAQKMARETPGQSFQPTDLVHEAYLRVVNGDELQTWESRGHFFAAAAEAMRRILVDRARHKHTLKAGGAGQRVDLDEVPEPADDRSDALLALDLALNELERHDPQAANLVKLRYFGGLKHHEAAQALGLTRGQADRMWALARAWLYRQISNP